MATYKELVNQTEVPYFVELYSIKINNTYIKLTNHKQSITHPLWGEFLPAIIERKDISYSSFGEITTDLIIYAGLTALQQIVNVELPFIQVQISIYFPNEKVTHTIFTGICKEIAVSSNYFVMLKLVDYFSITKVNIPKLTYSAYCNNSFGDQHCKVNLSHFSIVTSVLETDNRTALYSLALTNYSEDYFTLGMVEFNYEGRKLTRLITKHSQSQGKVYLQLPFEVSVDNQTVRIIAGCNKSPYSCKYKFNNIRNFTGFPYIPIKNPAIWGI
ncbi:MAG: phage BR0599 family protein [Nanopusillaceae archaeon]